MDTIGINKLVLLMEVSFVKGSVKIQNGTRKVSLIVRSVIQRCPLQARGFHVHVVIILMVILLVY